MNETVKEWITKSEGDYNTASREMHADANPNYDAVCFHSQQCIEKLMKAILIDNEIIVPRTHDLIYLNSELANIRKSNLFQNIDITDLRFLNRAAVDFRYPGEFADESEAKMAFDICDKLRSILKEYFK